MTTRARHRRDILRDADVLHALAVAGLALLGTGGLLYIWYLREVRRVSREVSSAPPLDGARAILVFGKHSRDGEPDHDFRTRIERARALVHARRDLPLLLLGGGPGPTEAQIAERALRAGPLPAGCALVLEHESRDTLQNLRHARELLKARGDGPAVLVSSRYHLARCALLARSLRLEYRLCAAEDAPPRGLGHWGPQLREAVHLMCCDVGQRWARLIGHRRMIARLS
jgi:uncharacterized SAM-binding protein YcdF (DUF218 family)